MLKATGTLTTLDLSSNYNQYFASSGSGFARALSAGLTTNATLVTLDLRWNAAGAGGAHALNVAAADGMREAFALAGKQVLEERRAAGDEALQLAGNLANMLQKQGKYDEARPMLEHSLEVHERTFGAEHPNTLATMGNLADLLAQQGDLGGKGLLARLPSALWPVLEEVLSERVAGDPRAEQRPPWLAAGSRAHFRLCRRRCRCRHRRCRCRPREEEEERSEALDREERALAKKVGKSVDAGPPARRCWGGHRRRSPG